MWRNRLGGFTLIEVLLVSALMLWIALSISTAFIQGKKIYQRLSQVVINEDIHILFEKLNQDIENYYPYSLLPLEVSSNKISFARVENTANQSEAPVLEPFHVQYTFDRTKYQLVRRYAPHYGLKNNLFDIKEEIIADKVRHVEFAKRGASGNLIVLEVLIEFGRSPHQQLLKRKYLLPL